MLWAGTKFAAALQAQRAECELPVLLHALRSLIVTHAPLGHIFVTNKLDMVLLYSRDTPSTVGPRLPSTQVLS
jgi:hypothetical protein